MQMQTANATSARKPTMGAAHATETTYPTAERQVQAGLFVDALTGKRLAYLRKLATQVGQPRLVEARQQNRLDDSMLLSLRVTCEMTEAYMGGKESMTGQPLAADGSIPAIPRLLSHGDAEAADRIRHLLRKWPEPLDEEDVLLKVLPELAEGVSFDRARRDAEDILDGHAPLGLLALYQLTEKFLFLPERPDVPKVHELLGVPERVRPPRNPRRQKDG